MKALIPVNVREWNEKYATPKNLENFAKWAAVRGDVNSTILSMILERHELSEWAYHIAAFLLTVPTTTWIPFDYAFLYMPDAHLPYLPQLKHLPTEARSFLAEYTLMFYDLVQHYGVSGKQNGLLEERYLGYLLYLIECGVSQETLVKLPKIVARFVKTERGKGYLEWLKYQLTDTTLPFEFKRKLDEEVRSIIKNQLTGEDQKNAVIVYWNLVGELLNIFGDSQNLLEDQIAFLVGMPRPEYKMINPGDIAVILSRLTAWKEPFARFMLSYHEGYFPIESAKCMVDAVTLLELFDDSDPEIVKMLEESILEREEEVLKSDLERRNRMLELASAWSLLSK